jgi:polyhydroxyalkanoate synthesis regulator phasin
MSSNASTLSHHMRRIAERAGVRWDSDCEAEIEGVVEDLEKQISDLRDEVRALRQQVPDNR